MTAYVATTTVLYGVHLFATIINTVTIAHLSGPEAVGVAFAYAIDAGLIAWGVTLLRGNP